MQDKWQPYVLGCEVNISLAPLEMVSYYKSSLGQSIWNPVIH